MHFDRNLQPNPLQMHENLHRRRQRGVVHEILLARGAHQFLAVKHLHHT